MMDWELTEKEIAAALNKEKPIVEGLGFQWFEVGLISAQAAQRKLMLWLDEICYEHPQMETLVRIRRFNCSQCWQELRKAVGL